MCHHGGNGPSGFHPQQSLDNKGANQQHRTSHVIRSNDHVMPLGERMEEGARIGGNNDDSNNRYKDNPNVASTRKLCLLK